MTDGLKKDDGGKQKNKGLTATCSPKNRKKVDPGMSQATKVLFF